MDSGAGSGAAVSVRLLRKFYVSPEKSGQDHNFNLKTSLILRKDNLSAGI